ncbi:MAG TPA: hypothetical protein VNJ08_03430 [Bacteriovoracaceae bacterium]|nr:hypothetical protein [Bacteriovoracaceae bacterium]
MERTLVKNSNIFLEKFKFFLNRALIYFSFLLLPVWIQKTLEINIFVQSLMMFCYLMFMLGQWYLLGKEIDHRFKIYFRANSSIDRVLYRVVIGNAFMILLFNLMSFIPDDIVKHFFWGFYVLIGFFYSWPTRGKIIEESVSTQFTEYKYLDAFEKVVLFLSVTLFICSMPSFPFLSNLETFKLIVDPEEKMNVQLWNYLHMNFFPFRRFPHLVNLGWSMHFYFISFGLYLISFYGIMRFFISRRLSMLGLFALISTWSFSLLLKKDPYTCATTTFTVLWVWSILWCVKSSTYRSGLMYGLLCYGGVVLNYNHFFLFPVGLALLYFYFLKENTDWYRNQFVKYTSLGAVLILMTLITHIDLRFLESGMSFHQLGIYLTTVIKRKAFYVLSYIGLISLIIMVIRPKWKLLTTLTIDIGRLRELSLLVGCALAGGLLMERDLIQSFGLLWFIVFLSILPLEWIFQSISRLRSRRNFIYVVYVLLCLLDSHIEGRFRILYNFYQSPPDIVELLNRDN